ncbi:MAG: glycosyltransferase family 2 protein [candidate division Zixibacteria bacterium]|nr:glycosyltransferase family 2 protein [candidate division Zixibacteria bacterium]
MKPASNNKKGVNLDRLVSAIVVNWNGMQFLPTCLDSVFKQSYKNIEVIVVDCASKDESVEFIRKNFPLTKIIELKEDKGPPYAINLAARQAEGDYILILNNDVILPEDMLSVLVKEMKKDENCVINPVELSWEREYRQAGCTGPWISHQLYKRFKQPGQVPSYPSTACCLVSKGVLKRIPLNENLFIYEDTEWGWRLHLKGIKLKVLLSASFLHKCEGTIIGDSPKSAFIYGRTPLATLFICFKWPTLSILLPFLLINYYLNPKRIGYLLVKRRLVPFLKGFFSFFEKLPLFIQDRKKVQKNRKINDLELLKIIIGSFDFQKNAKKKWDILNKKSEPKDTKEQRVTVWS